MPEHYGKTQNLSFYDQVLLSAGERAKALTLQMTGGQPNPAIETKITLGLLAQIVAPVVSEGLSAQAREMGAESRIALRDKATAGRAEQHALRTNLRKKAREDIMRLAKRLGGIKAAEILITEGPKIYEGWRKVKAERDAEEYAAWQAEGDEADEREMEAQVERARRGLRELERLSTGAVDPSTIFSDVVSGEERPTRTGLRLDQSNFVSRDVREKVLNASRRLANLRVREEVPGAGLVSGPDNRTPEEKYMAGERVRRSGVDAALQGEVDSILETPRSERRPIDMTMHGEAPDWIPFQPGYRPPDVREARERQLQEIKAEPGPVRVPASEGALSPGVLRAPDKDLFDLSGTRYAEDADYWTDIIMNPTLETERVLQKRLK